MSDRQPSVPVDSLRLLGGGFKRWTNNVSRGAALENRTRVGQPSAPIGGHRRPSQGWRWWSFLLGRASRRHSL